MYHSQEGIHHEKHGEKHGDEMTDGEYMKKRHGYHRRHRSNLDEEGRRLVVLNHAAIIIQQRWRAYVAGNEARRKYAAMYAQRNAARDFCIYITYIFIIVSVIIARTPSKDVFMMQENMRDLVVDEEFMASDTHIYKSFNDVATEEELWQYLKGPLKNNLFPDDCFADKILNKTCIGRLYRTVYLLGGVRLRQVRSKKMEKSVCENYQPSFMNDANIDCYEPYDVWHYKQTGFSRLSFGYDRHMLGEAVRTPDIPIKPSMASKVEELHMESCFQYSYDPKFTGTIYIGKDEYTEYPSGIGYKCDLLVREGWNVADIFQILHDNEWIDDSTRVLFIEMTALNPSLGTLSSVQLMVEFPPSGGLLTKFALDSASLFASRSLFFDIVFETSQVIITIFNCYYLHSEFLEMREIGISKYFQSAWNYFDLLQYGLLITSHFISFWLRSLEKELVEDAGITRNYVPLIEYVNASNFGNWVFSVAAIVCTLKFFKYMQTSPNLGVLIDTLQHAKGQLGYFLIVLAVLTFGFALAFYATFSAHSMEFRTISSSCTVLFASLVGQTPEYQPLYDGNRLVGPVLYNVYMFCVAVIAFSMFLTIISDEYSYVKSQVASKMIEEKEVDMLLHRMRHNIGATKWFLVAVLGGKSARRRLFIKRVLGLQDKEYRYNGAPSSSRIKTTPSQFLNRDSAIMKCKKASNKYSVQQVSKKIAGNPRFDDANHTRLKNMADDKRLKENLEIQIRKVMHACEEELKLCEERKVKILSDMRTSIMSAIEHVDSSIQM